jgi:hypothetical protein
MEPQWIPGLKYFNKKKSKYAPSKNFKEVKTVIDNPLLSIDKQLL